VLVPVPQGKLIDEHCAQCKATGIDQPLRWHLAVRVKEAFELFVAVFNRPRAQFVQDAAHPDAVIRVWRGATTGRHHGLADPGPGGVDRRGRVMLSAPHRASLRWQLRPQSPGLRVSAHGRSGQVGSPRHPDASHRRDQGELPPIHPPCQPAWVPWASVTLQIAVST
jgi:hypothetical protein